MCEQKILQIRQSIELATAYEQQSHELQKYLQSTLPRLHTAIDLPGQNPSAALLDFVVQYIQQVPDVLETLVLVLKQSGTYASCEVFVTIAEDFFLKPPEIAQGHAGLHALINEAYLANRLLEEINDRLMMLCGTQLMPIDMTLPNIIVHDLLGEEFANRLDLAVHYAIEALFQEQNFDRQQLAQLNDPRWKQAWISLLARWPNLAESGDVQLRFTRTDSDTDSIH